MPSSNPFGFRLPDIETIGAGICAELLAINSTPDGSTSMRPKTSRYKAIGVVPTEENAKYLLSILLNTISDSGTG
jgi:hypothetical protein